jgi:hypothetical protein
MYLPISPTLPICSSILITASFAPPCAGPQSADIPAAIAEYGFVPELPARRTVEVLQFCSWSACKMNNRSSASAATGFTVYSSDGTAKNMCSRLLQ